MVLLVVRQRQGQPAHQFKVVAAAAGQAPKLERPLVEQAALRLLALVVVVAAEIKRALQYINQAALAEHRATSRAVRQAQLTATAPQSKAATACLAWAQHPVPVVVAAAHLTAPTPSLRLATAATAAHRAVQAVEEALASTPSQTAETAAQAHAARYGLWNTKMTRLPEHLPSV
jgi:hypothetical protein